MFDVKKEMCKEFNKMAIRAMKAREEPGLIEPITQPLLVVIFTNPPYNFSLSSCISDMNLFKATRETEKCPTLKRYVISKSKWTVVGYK